MKKTLRVTMSATEPSVVELTLGDRVQLDRIHPSSSGGPVAERYGGLVGPGTTKVALQPGFYQFRTLSDASLRVVSGGVQTGVDGISPGDDPKVPGTGGDEVPGPAPELTVES